MRRPIVAVVARAPSVEGKTRLFGLVDTDDPEALRRAFFLDTLDAVIDAEGVDAAVAFTPAAARAEIDRLVPAPIRRLPQRGRTLGDRMHNAIVDLLREAPAVILVGSDLPTLPPAFLTQAVTLLGERPDRVVIGPAEDGGYFLIGMSSPRRELFDAMPWGTPAVLDRTLAKAAASGIEVVLLPPWYDVDEAAALRRVVTDAGQGPAAGRGRRTRDWIAAHGLA